MLVACAVCRAGCFSRSAMQHMGSGTCTVSQQVEGRPPKDNRARQTLLLVAHGQLLMGHMLHGAVKNSRGADLSFALKAERCRALALCWGARQQDTQRS